MNFAPAAADDPIARALDYPYEAPGGSYLFRDGRAEALPGGYEFAGRVPVIAHGSNRAPAQLFRKFGAVGEIPVTAIWLDGYDVVFAAQFARYGAIPATLWPVPGVRARLHLTWLDDSQLRVMHVSEGVMRPDGGPVAAPRYGIRLLATAACDLRGTVADPLVYLALQGALCGRALDGVAGPIAFTGIEVEGRSLPQATGREVIAGIARRHFAETAEGLVTRIAADEALRQAATDALSPFALAPDLAGCRNYTVKA
ncbi:MAG: hypothetical protein KJ904_15910 [Alphaproteobacteria bacterium]|nr:hypothetical protein [Alphaproteobacteria bacterium]MBU0798213.1 hypothetical protein [Alphaproteobacteria bacterium]MBU0888641.1 hypothetical protein [Alphaproteobacteria bacterium]MBU1813625.1 hypothetical protein [Alphaproteobacteria bacterium]MBU2091152.1 hypothetical protein [Alphaproteobacteria bacterium]